ncbi:MAG TPA: glycosyltransferase family 1 protein [Bauldia sp.]|nr:glycosyltransferase family 1 protein [Bauldia sp.]
MKLLVATDAWQPQVNGVVRSIERLCDELPHFGVEVSLISPAGFRTLPLPSYPEIRLAITRRKTVRAMIEATAPDAVHIATEGPVGYAVRRWCLEAGMPFTTCYHTRFPEYVAARIPVPTRWTYAALRRFHNAGDGCMVATASLERVLRAHGFENLRRWSRGVNSDVFRPREENAFPDLPRPIFIFVGRVAVEKNIAGFLSLDLPGSKVVVGDGPALDQLKRAFPSAHFTGVLTGDALAAAYSSADVFVFPSRTDTFGMVLLEALASGVPIAAFPVTGPQDVIGSAPVGILDEDLRKAALAALDIPRERCRDFALGLTWRACARQFLDNVVAGDPSLRPLLAAAE